MSSSLYIGKVFTLKNVRGRGIPWCTHTARKCPGTWSRDFYKWGWASAEELGAHVMVIDERTKQVKIICSKTFPVWISRYYLQTEISEEVGSPGGELGIVLTELGSLTKKISDAGAMKELSEIIKRIRSVKETIEKET